jgi:hypothetical protein
MSVVILATLVLAAACSAGEFAADLTRTQKGKSEIGKVYVKGDKVREEVVVDGETGVTILRMDKRVSWVLMADNTYMEIALPVSVDRIPEGYSKFGLPFGIKLPGTK